MEVDLMARYELGAIYKIDGGEKSYYARLAKQLLKTHHIASTFRRVLSP